MPIHYNTIEDGQNKISRLLVSGIQMTFLNQKKIQFNMLIVLPAYMYSRLIRGRAYGIKSSSWRDFITLLHVWNAHIQ